MAQSDTALDIFLQLSLLMIYFTGIRRGLHFSEAQYLCKISTFIACWSTLFLTTESDS